MRRGRTGSESFDPARARRPPRFAVVDESLRVTFSGDGDSAMPELTVPVRDVVDRLRRQIDAHAVTWAVAACSPTEIVRLQRLDGGDARPHFAVFVESYAVRNLIKDASERFALSSRESAVLAGLMRGKGTAEIAAQLRVATTTVREYVRKLGHKTNVSKRSEIVAAAVGLR